jgi:hypothetical protein
MKTNKKIELLINTIMILLPSLSLLYVSYSESKEYTYTVFLIAYSLVYWVSFFIIKICLPWKR